MTFAAKIIADSISPAGVRLTTMEITFPRIILAEFNTHRMLSRNSASSRAIPVEKMMRMVTDNPYIPTHWGKNQKGMQADEEVDARTAEMAKTYWLEARSDATWKAGMLMELGIHKQLTNRLLEPFMWHTVIVTATEWDNFFHLRTDKNAHPEIQRIAKMMREVYETAVPTPLNEHEWHTPYIHYSEKVEILKKIDDAAELPQGYVPEGWSEKRQQQLNKISVARCARVSYLTHDGKRDIEEDLKLHDRLLSSGHLSPFEHVARPAAKDDSDLQYGAHAEQHPMLGTTHLWFGNFRGWLQYRKTIPGEHDILGTRIEP